MSEQPVAVDFDHHSPEHALDPAASFERLRAQCPVAHSDRYGGYWIATSYQGVFDITRDPVTFETSPEDGMSPISVPPTPRPIPLVPVEIPAPDFMGYRRVLNPYMSPKAVRDMQEGISYYADFFVDRIIERGEIDLLSDLAFPTPATITFDWMGLPLENWKTYATTLHDALHTPADSPRWPAVSEAMRLLLSTIGAELEARRGEPRGDMLSVIANDPLPNGQPISREHAVGMAGLVITGGLSTTALLLSHTLIHLEGHTDVHARLLTDDRYLHTATEEFLRFASPITSEARRVGQDTTIEGTQLTRGEQVLISFIAANRDPAVFENPNEIDLERWPNRHIAFGAGPHRCIGSNLGRAMYKTLLRTILRRMPDYRVTNAVPGHNRGTDNSFERVDIAFTPGRRITTDHTPTRQFAITD
jgi:cytochrome P450